MTHYPRYKPTALPWPDQIPDSWELVKIGAVFIERKETVSDKDFQPLSVTMDGIVPQLETAAKTDNGDNRKKVSVGDFVINSRSDRKGSSGVSNFEGSVSVISTVLKPSPKLNGKYIDYLLRNYYFKEEFYRNGKGIVADLWSTKYANMKGMQIPLPSLEEQTAIAFYLDGKCALIDTFIAKKQKLIELLHEQKQAIINKAVTRGINPNVRLKPSGIEWLGEIPEHWEVRKLKRCVTQITSGITPSMEVKEYWNGDIPWVSPKDMKQEKIETSELKITKKALDETSSRLVPISSVLMVVRSGILQRTLPIAITKVLVAINQDIKAITIDNRKFLVDYFAKMLRGIESEVLASCRKVVATVDSVEMPYLLNFPLTIPPVNEQRQILEYVEAEGQKIIQIIIRIEKEIELIQEYKQSLIAEVVRGKVNVTKS